MHSKREEIIWVCVKDNVVGKMRSKNKLDCMIFIVNYFRKRRVGGVDRD